MKGETSILREIPSSGRFYTPRAQAVSVALERLVEGRLREAAGPRLGPEALDHEGVADEPPLEAPDEAAAVEERVDVPPPAPRRRGLVDLPDVVEPPEVLDQLP